MAPTQEGKPPQILMKIDDYLDIEQLVSHIENELVDSRHHDTLPLNILTYSRNAVYDDKWDDVTCKCRGLIVTDDGVIIARPFEKFFNIDTSYREETWLSNLPKEQPQVQEKLDGSLGILYTYEGVSAIASKGSFHSDHAKWATKWYQEHCKEAQWPEGYTPIFEMICQEVQTHVVRYSTEDQLVLLALINNETGEEASYENLHYWGTLNEINVVDVYDKSVGTVLNEDRPNAEGYVLSWPRPGQTPLKIKIKHETFLTLQKIVHNATPKSMLKLLIDGKEAEIAAWMETPSKEVNDFVQGWFSRFTAAYAQTVQCARDICITAKMRFDNRKDVAEFFHKEENKLFSAVCFAMLDGKDYKKIVWKSLEDLIEDAKDVHFLDGEEDVEDHDEYTFS